jgi:hypothetical protein
MEFKDEIVLDEYNIKDIFDHGLTIKTKKGEYIIRFQSEYY